MLMTKLENSRAYNRKKTRDWKRDDHEPIPGFYFDRFLPFSFPVDLLHADVDPYSSSQLSPVA